MSEGAVIRKSMHANDNNTKNSMSTQSYFGVNMVLVLDYSQKLIPFFTWGC